MMRDVVFDQFADGVRLRKRRVELNEGRELVACTDGRESCDLTLRYSHDGCE